MLEKVFASDFVYVYVWCVWFPPFSTISAADSQIFQRFPVKRHAKNRKNDEGECEKMMWHKGEGK